MNPGCGGRAHKQAVQEPSPRKGASLALHVHLVWFSAAGNYFRPFLPRSDNVSIDIVRQAKEHFRGFSLIELMVVIGIIAILIALLLPVLTRVQAAARVVQCQSNLRQVGQAMFMYANTNKGWLIPMDDDPSAVGGLRGFGTLCRLKTVGWSGSSSSRCPTPKQTIQRITFRK